MVLNIRGFMQNEQATANTQVAPAEKLIDVTTIPGNVFADSPDPDKWFKLVNHHSYDGIRVLDWLRKNAGPLDDEGSTETIDGAAFFNLDAYHFKGGESEGQLREVDEITSMVCYLRLKKPRMMLAGVVWARKTARLLLETFPSNPGKHCIHHLDVIKPLCNPTEFLVAIHFHEQTVIQ